MNRSMFMLLAAAFVGAGALSGPADAAVSVGGKGPAQSCFEHAESGRRIDSGLKDCNLALGETPLSVRDRAATLVNRGILHTRNKDLKAAIRDYDTAIRMKPNLAAAHVNKGILLVYVGRDAEAVDAITRGLQLKPEQPEVAYYNRGMAHELMGNDEAAYNDYRQAAALKPDWAEPKEQLRRFAADRSS